MATAINTQTHEGMETPPWLANCRSAMRLRKVHNGDVSATVTGARRELGLRQVEPADRFRSATRLSTLTITIVASI